METPWTPKERKDLERIALAMVETCVRNTQLEALHAGRGPVSATGDYSDVKVVDAEGEIPWTRLSRISDEEMKALMIQIVDRVFTFLSFPDHLPKLGAAARWDRPKLDPVLMRIIQDRKAIAEGADPASVYGDRAKVIMAEILSARTDGDD